MMDWERAEICSLLTQAQLGFKYTCVVFDRISEVCMVFPRFTPQDTRLRVRLSVGSLEFWSYLFFLCALIVTGFHTVLKQKWVTRNFLRVKVRPTRRDDDFADLVWSNVSGWKTNISSSLWVFVICLGKALIT